MRLLFTLAALISSSAVMATEPQTLRVIGIHDGDTVKAIDAANAQHKIRLQGDHLDGIPDARADRGVVGHLERADIASARASAVAVKDKQAIPEGFRDGAARRVNTT